MCLVIKFNFEENCYLEVVQLAMFLKLQNLSNFKMKAKNFVANVGDLVAFVIDDLQILSFKYEKHLLPKLQLHDSLLIKQVEIFEVVKLASNIATTD